MKLVDLSSQQSTVGSPSDLVKDLQSDGIVHLLGIVCEAYENLYMRRIITCGMIETEITEELVVELEIIWAKKGPYTLIPVHEKSHGKRDKGKGKSATIDLCFRTHWSPDFYFGIECKILEDKNKRYKYYINDGVCRYISGDYSKKISTGAIVGYILNGDSAKIISEVITRVKELPEAPTMKISYPICNFREHYESVHNRQSDSSPFGLHHLFLCFT